MRYLDATKMPSSTTVQIILVCTVCQEEIIMTCTLGRSALFIFIEGRPAATDSSTSLFSCHSDTLCEWD